ncbi:short-chain dehydrogenase/reductase SDR [Pseudopedobacter saltans DSM 12145]|uniref:Short-chain dehydrogenase/reductase SDR n=1 Tax=Pseudopedobacter saltans (strain ATCC 51119 / DSM 12145 / JCM 21818 / CCUG 39354 / LMG 10337 / NBRC 100064 / NCIMB 13643) TaxID=762903 RepID=F0S800_PSESL|nr:SDR family oxidoreductase [Pseudopedobacter saltans]ADY51221.1 short-chain dehydrogenase/reductase SDR [Pseudopedobacter saltans DSM 12145]
MSLYALITGASGGIGRAIAYKLASHKINLILVSRSEQKLNEVASDISAKFDVDALYLSLDLSYPDSNTILLNFLNEKNIGINILVNNAGYGLSGPLLNTGLSDWINMLSLNMISLTSLTYTFLPILKSQQKGYILNIASIAAYQSIPFLSLYAASKSFVLSFSRGLAKELEGSGVSVTCVSPGPTDTEFIVRARVGRTGQHTAKRVNMTPEEVASIAVKAMFSERKEIVPGLINKMGVFLSWLLPKSLVESVSAKIYQ